MNLDKLNILFNTSPGSFKSPGGGEIQLLKTKEELQKLGHKIKILEKERYAVKWNEFDVFHNFNIHRDNHQFVKKAKESGLPVALSTIYWPSLKHALFWNRGTKRKAMGFASELLNKFGSLSNTRVSKIVKSANMLLPNSKAEAAVLQKQFGVLAEKIHVVPNGVEKRFKKAEPKLFEEKTGLRDFVLFVGRVEARKNVLGLIRAMNESKHKLVIIGGPIAGSEDYHKQCMREAGNNIVFMNPVPHESKMLESAYAACKVFCLPSWYETPGLAALEAGLAGTNIIVTSHGCTKEYFGDYAFYVDPSIGKDIVGKINQAMKTEKCKDLARHIEENFLWENAATETEKAYEKMMVGK